MTAETLPRSVLFPVQREARAAFGEVDGWEMPRVYENIKMEYLAAKGTVAVIDRSQHGRLIVSGARRFDLLNRLTTNDLRQIGPGQGSHTVLLTDKGRLIDDLRLYARDGDYYLVTSPGNQLRVKEHIEKLRFRDDVTLTDVTSATAMISLYGPQSAHLLEGVTHAHHLAALAPHHHAEVAIGSAGFLAARTTEVGGAGFALIVKRGDAEVVWRALLTRGEAYGTSPMGEEAYEMVRIEFGVPRFGREITADHNPLETRLDDAISWTKGCYIGQEVIARLDSRQKVSRLLVGLWLEPGPVPDAGSAIEDPARPGTPIGTLTSVAPSLDYRRVIGLAFVRNDLSAAGTRLVVAALDDRVDAVVSDLPFRKP
mgnify:CR=1 FL=1